MSPISGVSPTPADEVGPPPASSASLAASFPSDSGACGTGLQPVRNAPEQYIPLSALPIPPGTTESAWRRKLARIAARSRQARKLRGQWHLHRDDLIDGRPAHKHLCGTGFQPVASTCGTGLQPVDGGGVPF